MRRPFLLVRIRTLLVVIALVAISFPISDRLRSRWLHCQERARRYQELAAMHRDAATWPGLTAWAVANQKRKALLADEISQSYGWASIIPLLPLPSDPLRKSQAAWHRYAAQKRKAPFADLLGPSYRQAAIVPLRPAPTAPLRQAR